jgi:hypothetical protein
VEQGLIHNLPQLFLLVVEVGDLMVIGLGLLVDRVEVAHRVGMVLLVIPLSAVHYKAILAGMEATPTLAVGEEVEFRQQHQMYHLVLVQMVEQEPLVALADHR